MKNMMTFGIYGRLAPANAATVAKPDIVTFEEVAQETTADVSDAASTETQVNTDETSK